MRRIISIIVGVLLLTSCHNSYVSTSITYVIANETEYLLDVEYVIGESNSGQVRLKPHKGEILLWEHRDGLCEEVSWEDLGVDIDSAYVKVFIHYPQGDSLARTWRYYERDEPGRQFFNMNHAFVEGSSDAHKPIYELSYEFHIRPDDLDNKYEIQ